MGDDIWDNSRRLEGAIEQDSEIYRLNFSFLFHNFYLLAIALRCFLWFGILSSWISFGCIWYYVS